MDSQQQQNRRLVILGIVAFFVLVSDQLTKFWAVKYLQGQPDVDMVGGMVRFIYAENTGAWGSLGQDWPEPVKLIVMTALPLGVLGWIGVRMVRDHNLPRLEAMAYALIISGGVGNIIDRIRLGYVVDFMWMGVGSLTTNIFNVADLSIVGAMILLVWEAFRAHKEKKKEGLPGNKENSPKEV